MRTGDGERSLASSVGGAAAVEHPTEVDRSTDLRSARRSPCGRWSATRRAADPGGRDRHDTARSSHARSPRAPHRPPPLGRDRRLARPHRLRRLRRRPGVDALVPVVLDPRLLRPTRRTSGRSSSSAPAMRPPNVVVFHTSGDATQSAAIARRWQRARAGEPGRADELVLLDRQPRVRLAATGTRRSWSSTRPARPTSTAPSGAAAIRAAAATRAAGGHHRPRDRPRPARRGEQARRHAAGRACSSRR